MVNTTGKKDLGHFVWSSFFMTTAGLLASFIHFLFNLLVVKQVSPEMYGEYSTTLSYVAIFITPLTVFGLIVVRKIGGQNLDKRITYAKAVEIRIFRTLQAKWIYFILLAALVFFVLFKWSNLGSVVNIIYILVITFLTFFVTFYSNVLSAFKYFVSISLISIIAALIKLIGGVSLVRFWPHLEIIYAVLLTVPLITIFFSRYIAFKKLSPQALPAHFGKLGRLGIRKQFFSKQFAVPFFSILSTTVLLNSDLVLLKIFLPSDQVGIYSVFSLFGKIVLYATTPVINVAYAFFTGKETTANSKRILLLALGLFLIFGAVMTIFYQLFAPQLIEIVSSATYLSLSNIIYLAAIFGALYSVVMLLSQFLVARNSWLVILGLLACVAQIILIVHFHQSFAQVMGINIATSSILIIIYTLLLSFKYLKRKYGNRY